MTDDDGPADDTAVRPFSWRVPEEALDDLRDRLRRTRFPDEETVDDWSQGVPLSHARELRDHWLHEHDWRAVERRLDDLGQFTTTVDGLPLHLLHVRSRHDDARPLVLTHGWPSTVLEFLDVIGPLTDPTAHGGDPRHAFHVVVPSLPGYGPVGSPATTGWTVERIADAWVALMDRLGHARFVAVGGDWGAMVTTAMAVRHPAALAGIHLTMPPARPHDDDLTAEERAAERDYQRYLSRGIGYATQQSTRPQALGYGLADSPMGQAAWIVDLVHEWTDHDGDHEQAVPRDRLLDTVTWTWLTNTATSSARLYWESWRRLDQTPVDVPTGVSSFPREIMRPSRRITEARFRDLRLFSRHDHGGHFPAVERPDALVADLRAFAGELDG